MELETDGLLVLIFLQRMVLVPPEMPVHPTPLDTSGLQGLHYGWTWIVETMLSCSRTECILVAMISEFANFAVIFMNGSEGNNEKNSVHLNHDGAQFLFHFTPREKARIIGRTRSDE